MAANSKKPCIGFDFGGAYLKLAVTDKKGVARLLVEPIPEGLVKDGEITSPGPLGIFLRELLKKNRVRAKECAFVLPARSAVFRRMSTPVMDARQIRNNLPFEFQDLMTEKKAKYYYDYALGGVKKNEAGEVTGLELMAMAVSRAAVDNYSRFFKKLGLKMRVAAPLESAYSNLIRYYEEHNPQAQEGEGYCLLDIGHDATRLHMYTGPLYEASRVIESGAALVDAAIARDLSISLEEARVYKESSQEATRHLKEASSAYASIALEIRKAVSYYNSSNPEKAIRHIYYFGGGARMTPLIDTVRDTVDQQMHDVFQLLPPIKGEAGGADICTTAIGITL